MSIDRRYFVSVFLPVAPDACFGVTCSNNGICGVIGLSTACICSAGFKGADCSQSMYMSNLYFPQLLKNTNVT